LSAGVECFFLFLASDAEDAVQREPTSCRDRTPGASMAPHDLPPMAADDLGRALTAGLGTGVLYRLNHVIVMLLQYLGFKNFHVRFLNGYLGVPA